MNEMYQVILVTAIVLIALNFFITRYYVTTSVEQAVDDAMEEKIRRANKKMMKAMKSTFEKYMGPDPRMIDPRMDPRAHQQNPDPRMMERHSNDSGRHRSRHHEEEDSIDDPAADDQYDDDESLE
jgi:hypothetical protein